jgi:hypothetical protein
MSSVTPFDGAGSNIPIGGVCVTGIQGADIASTAMTVIALIDHVSGKCPRGWRENKQGNNT